MEADNITATLTVTDLPLLTCHIVELPDSRMDCSLSDPSICVRCPVLGRFLAGGGLDEYGSRGHIVSLAEWIITLIIGVFGTFTNCLIITILKRQKAKRAFDLLLIALACFDLMGSVLSVVASTATAANFENWSRGFTSQLVFHFGTLSCFFARSGSSFMTVLISAERYFVIAFPLHSRFWFTSGKTKLYAGLVFLIATSIAIPRYTSFYIVPNYFPRDIASLANLDYVIVATPLEQFWYGTLGAYFSALDFWVPLPLLLLFNILVHVEIWKFTRRQTQMNTNQQQDIQTIKMFVPVVVALFLCNIEPYTHFYYVKAKRLVAREHFLGVFLSVAVNSAVNLPIYYFKGDSFKEEVRALCYNIDMGWSRRKGQGTRDRCTSFGSGVPVCPKLEDGDVSSSSSKWKNLAEKYLKC